MAISQASRLLVINKRSGGWVVQVGEESRSGRFRGRLRNAKFSLRLLLKKTAKCKMFTVWKIEKEPIAFSCCCVRSTIGASHRYAMHSYIIVVQQNTAICLSLICIPLHYCCAMCNVINIIALSPICNAQLHYCCAPVCKHHCPLTDTHCTTTLLHYYCETQCNVINIIALSPIRIALLHYYIIIVKHSAMQLTSSKFWKSVLHN